MTAHSQGQWPDTHITPLHGVSGNSLGSFLAELLSQKPTPAQRLRLFAIALADSNGRNPLDLMNEAADEHRAIIARGNGKRGGTNPEDWDERLGMDAVDAYFFYYTTVSLGVCSKTHAIRLILKNAGLNTAGRARSYRAFFSKPPKDILDKISAELPDDLDQEWMTAKLEQLGVKYQHQWK